MLADSLCGANFRAFVEHLKFLFNKIGLVIFAFSAALHLHFSFKKSHSANSGNKISKLDANVAASACLRPPLCTDESHKLQDADKNGAYLDCKPIL